MIKRYAAQFRPSCSARVDRRWVRLDFVVPTLGAPARTLGLRRGYTRSGSSGLGTVALLAEPQAVKREQLFFWLF